MVLYVKVTFSMCPSRAEVDLLESGSKYSIAQLLFKIDCIGG